MIQFRVAWLLPIVVLALIIVVALAAAGTDLRRPSVTELLLRTVVYAVAAAAISLGGTIAWMIWYEKTTGYSAGNAPLGWIFYYGPLSAGIGEFIALIHWSIRIFALRGAR
jgi:hypothetical protein